MIVLNLDDIITRVMLAAFDKLEAEADRSNDEA
jgi:hypothetical protein